MLQGIAYRCLWETGALLSLPTILDSVYFQYHPTTRLIVIDNFSNCLRSSSLSTTGNEHLQCIRTFLKRLSQIAKSQQIAVVVVNTIRDEGNATCGTFDAGKREHAEQRINRHWPPSLFSETDLWLHGH